ncbi:TetR/AcrR family transcriptional regulator [Smaragdicoccus niigatensis]|uniref:TetR/AcrR family transcriptional regulator n=1 Tax=Smaragdicoccus niigatensis TaxID=359359 RepID=UPI000377226A|nr:TetR/AcrR family transcriptional regulator [Smaragdicoccus niigatensis]
MDARDRIIAGAIEMFAERGVAGTSIADVIERSGGPRGSMYHYFPAGKSQLAEESTLAAGRLMTAVINRLCAERGPSEALAKIVDYFRKRLVNSDFEYGCPVAAGALAGAESPGAATAAGEAFVMWQRALSAALWQAGYAVDQAEDAASAAVSAIEGALLVCQAQKSTDALDRVERFLTTQLTGG